MSETVVWGKCQKRPVVVEFRQVRGDEEVIQTPEGAMKARRLRHLIIRGVDGEEYPILGTVFAKTYDVLPKWLQDWPTHEAYWKTDLVGRIWAYARSSGVLIVDAARDDAGRERLPPGLGDLIHNIRCRCDRCGKTPEQARVDSRGLFGVETYQCCWVHTFYEDYAPKLCIDCHNELKRIWPHEVISV